jgi:hypothetical protein
MNLEQIIGEREMKRNKNIGWIGLFLCASLWGAPYTDNGNGTVTDSATGLIWQQCPPNLSTIGCGGSMMTYTWVDAISYCEGLSLGGRSDWRLPNVNELRSILDITKVSSPLIDSIAFPNALLNSPTTYYWSSTTVNKQTTDAFRVNLSNGQVDFGNGKVGYLNVRCVTGN